MNKALITTIVAVLVIAGGLFALGLVARMPSSTTSNTGSQGSQATNITGPVVVTTSPGGTTTPAQTPGQTTSSVGSGIQTFTALLEQLQGREFSFVAVDSTKGTLGAIYALYASDVAQSKKVFTKAKDFSMHMATVDLNEDGVSEVVVYEDLPGFCGTAGCPLDIYQKKGTSWTSIFSAKTVGEPGLSNVSTSGYQDLYLTAQVEGYISNVVKYAWNGKTYAPKQAVATWDGTQFTLAQ